MLELEAVFVDDRDAILKPNVPRHIWQELMGFRRAHCFDRGMSV